MKATEQEIDKMIGLIELQKSMLPEYSFFGTNNWHVCDSQLEVLRNAKDGEFPGQDDLDEMDSDQYYVAMWLLDTSSNDLMSELEESNQ